jgi:transposase
MSDRFDITLERKLESSAEETAGGSSPVHRIELITGTGRRRQWSSADKARILVESFEPGANVSEVARRNGLSPQQLFAWRREARALFEEETGTAMPAEAAPSRRRKARAGPSPEAADERPQFVPVVMRAAAQAAPPSGSPPPPLASLARIEIVIGDVVVRVSGPIEASTLVAVLAAVRRTS